MQLLQTSIPTPFDNISIVWLETQSGVLIQRIFLSDSKSSSESKVKASFQQIETGSSPLITELTEKILIFLDGKEVDFDLNIVDFNRCYATQKRVILAEYEIPQGWVSTYKRIADHLDISNGARAVGSALARNPFPIIIPCHRAIKTDGGLGGYQGGVKMKRDLLEMEGVKFSKKGNVIMDKVYY
ncbi:MAG: methylated-DNA--[protein]-cysteine S-methyltransferase [Candidatus Sifarchaeia archaeon]